MNKTNTKIFKTDYHKLVQTISENPTEFIGKLKKSFLKTTPKIEQLEKSFKLSWELNNITHVLLFLHKENGEVEIKFTKNPSSFQLILSTIMVIAISYTAKWNIWEILGVLLFIWAIIPLFLKLQSEYLSSTYLKIIETAYQL
jgi:hypothetical protein